MGWIREGGPRGPEGEGDGLGAWDRFRDCDIRYVRLDS